MIPLFILRPEPGASATARRATAMGLEPVVCPLFVVEPVAWDAPDAAQFDSLLLTSANAIRYGGDALQRYVKLTTFTVGSATAQAASDAGFATIIEGSGDAADALESLAKAGHARPLHLAGEDRTPYPPVSFAIPTRTVYTARPTDVTLPTGVHVALLHSARAATRFAELCKAPEHIHVIAISRSVAAAAGSGWRSIATAPQPTDNAMLALAATLCDGQPTLDGRR